MVRCDYCGCVLQNRLRSGKKSLATRKQQKAIIAEACASGDGDSIRARLAAYGHCNVWYIGYRCPGCAMQGGFGTMYERPEDAEAVVTAQNQFAETAEAREESVYWKQEVRRRAEREARVFTDRVLARFPVWGPHLRSVPYDEVKDSEDPPFDCALILRVPSANPAVDAPLEARVQCREVLVAWGDLTHAHVLPDRDGDPADVRHLERAVDLLESVVGERIVVGVRYRDGQVSGSFSLPAAADPPSHGMDPRPEGADRILLRSWRGTYDHVLYEADDVAAGS